MLRLMYIILAASAAFNAYISSVAVQMQIKEEKGGVGWLRYLAAWFIIAALVFATLAWRD